MSQTADPSDGFWTRWGPVACIVFAAMFILSGALIALAYAGIGIPDDPPHQTDFARIHELALLRMEQVWRSNEFWVNVAFLIGIFMLIPIALALRWRLRRSGGIELATTILVVGSAIGVISGLVDLGVHEFTFAYLDSITRHARQAQDIPQLAMMRGEFDTITDWMDVGFWVLAGLAMVLVGALVVRRHVGQGVPIAWGVLGLWTGVFCIAFGVITPTRSGQLYSLLGGLAGIVFSPLWALWLALILRGWPSGEPAMALAPDEAQSRDPRPHHPQRPFAPRPSHRAPRPPA